MQKLEKIIGTDNPLTVTINNILAQNEVKIQDDKTTSNPIKQSNGVLQGDPLSPLLFNIAISDITEIIRETPSVKMYLYADDIIIGSNNKVELQTAMDRLEIFSRNNSLAINYNKTVQMVFRKGGKVAENDKIKYNEEELNIVNSFRYLGVTLQPTMTSFRGHTRERALAAIRGMYDIENPTTLSISTAMNLFYAKIFPVITYGLELTWMKLKVADLKIIESVKSRFLKRVLGVSKLTPSRLTYELAQEPFFIEELRWRLQLPSTKAEAEFIRSRWKKRDEITQEFYATDAMLDRSWMQPNSNMRSALTRLAVHGFHHKLCKRQGFHEPTEQCKCVLCDKLCERYHFSKCQKRTDSLMNYAKTQLLH